MKKITMNDVEEFNPNWKKDILKVAEEGATHGEYMAATGLKHCTYNRMLKEESELSDVIEMALLRAQRWWEEYARKGGLTGKSNSTSLIFNMANRFKADWKQKQEVGFTDGDGKDVNPVTIILAKQENTYQIEEHGVTREVTIKAEIEDNTK